MKLTNAQRDTILKRIIAHRFDTQRDALKAKGTDLADKLYQVMYDDADRAILLSAPQGFFAYNHSIDVWMSNPKRHERFFFSKRMPLKAVTNHWLEIDSTHPLYSAFDEWFDAQKAFYADKSAAEKQVSATLQSFSTMNKLVAEWPEVAPFITGLTPVIKNLPAINVSALNALLDLPVNQDG